MDRDSGRRRGWETSGLPSALPPARPMAAIGTDLGPTPSDGAAERLARTLHERTAEYRTDATIDLTMVEALLKVEGPEAASEALDGHASSLGALVADLHAALAEATVERDAEAILTTAS